MEVSGQLHVQAALTQRKGINILTKGGWGGDWRVTETV
jgi:hypothetical protein